MQYAQYGFGYVTVAAEYGQDISVMMDLYISALDISVITAIIIYWNIRLCLFFNPSKFEKHQEEGNFLADYHLRSAYTIAKGGEK